MSACESLRPQLWRVADGEASPDEAMQVARHLSDCTACRIHLARERRLGAMLAEMDDRLQVGEDFVRAVMENLPQGPPPVSHWRKRRRYLKLAGLGAWILAAPALLARAWPFERYSMPLPELGAPDLEGGERLLTALVGLVRTLPVAIDSLSALLPPLHVAIGIAGLAILLTLSAALTTAGCALAMLAAATGGLLGRR